ncbi:MAG: hypothetical protein ACOC8H_00230 [bacterium]
MVGDNVAAGSPSPGAQVLDTKTEGVDREYWENELETSVEQPLREAQDRRRMGKWITGLSPRQRTVLCRHLGIEAEKSGEQRTALEGCNGELVPFYLVDRFAWRKSKFAVADHGHRAEWTILDFADNARRVNLSSISPDVPVGITNALASTYYGEDVEYDNEREITYTAQITRLLNGHCYGFIHEREWELWIG